MYTTKQVLNAHGRLTIKALFYVKGGSVNGVNVPSGVYEEIGSSQSYNVSFEVKVLFNDALFNAFYRLLFKLGIPTYEATGDDLISKLCSKVKITNYTFDYYEDRIYTYKRVRKEITDSKTGKTKNAYVVEIRRKGKYHDDVKSRYVKKSEIQEHEDRFY